MFCSKCSSGDIQKASLVYESGITHSTSRSRGRGIGFGPGGIGVGFGGATTKGVHVSATAQRVAPPFKKPIGWPIAISIIALFVMLASMPSALSTAFFSLLVAGVAGFVTYQRIAWNRNMFPPLLERWSQSYLCKRCGTMMIPLSAEPIQVSSQAQFSVDSAQQPALSD